MRAQFPRGWLWVGDDSDDLTPEWTRAAYPFEHVHTDILGDRTTQLVPRRAVVQHAVQSGSGGSYFVQLGASLRPDSPDELHLEVAEASGQSGLDRVLVTAVREGARAGAARCTVAGRLRLDRALVHLVDCKPARYHQAAQLLVRALAHPDLLSLAAPELAALAASLWQDA